MEPEPIPLSTGTRVTLHSVVIAFRDEASAEAIAQRYPTLCLADIYSVIGYYLRHRDEVEPYLGERADEAARLRGDIEARFDPVGVRERLLARRERPRRPFSSPG